MIRNLQSSRLQCSTIVVATDLSQQASPALRYAQALARAHHATLVLVHTIDPVGYAFPEGAPESLTRDAQALEACCRIEAELREQNIPVHSLVERGIVCERILQSLQDHHADLLVLGTRVHGEAGRTALGTIARELLAHAPCPILTIPPDAESLLPNAGHWRRILAATDFSPASLEGLQLAQDTAGSYFVALHIAQGAGSQRSQQLEQLRYFAPFNESHTVPAEHIVVTGDPAAAIAEYAQRFHIDLVVLGAPDKILAEEDLASSTVLNVIAQSPCPVLCVGVNRHGRASEAILEEAVAC